MKHSETVFLVDDEPALLKALGRLLKAEGFAVQAFDSAMKFLSAPHNNGAGCILLDQSMPEMSGMELQQRLIQEDSALAVIFITGNGDIPMSVRAIKAGAVDFLTKPVKDKELLAVIQTALEKSRIMLAAKAELNDWKQRHAALSEREKEVLLLVVKGLPNKIIAANLGVVEQTIKVHRGRVMSKMGVDSLAQLVLVTERLQLK
jgi:FixJ family two-component response regulator